MSDFTQSPELRSLIKAAFDDAKSIQSRYPHQLLLALADQRVQEVLDSQFRAGQILTNLTPLPAQLDTGLIPIYFTFATSSSVQLTSKCILVQLNHRAEVIAIDQDFVPKRPNPHIDLGSGRSKLPLALATSKSRTPSQRIDPVVLKQIHRLGDELIIHHGLLLNVDLAAEGGGQQILMATESMVLAPALCETVQYTIVYNTDGSVGDTFRDEALDPCEEYQLLLDDTEETTGNRLSAQLGFPPI